MSTADGSVADASALNTGDNHLMGVGGSKTDTNFTEPRGLASSSAQAVGSSAIDDLTEVFRLSSIEGDNRFSVSVNGINGIVEVPSGFYVGSSSRSFGKKNQPDHGPYKWRNSWWCDSAIFQFVK